MGIGLGMGGIGLTSSMVGMGAGGSAFTPLALHIDSDIDTVGERDDIAAMPLWFATQDVFNIVGLTASAPDSSIVEYQNCIDAYNLDRPTLLRKVTNDSRFKTAAALTALKIQGPTVDAPAVGYRVSGDASYAAAHSCAQLMIANALAYGDPASSDPKRKLWIVVQGGYVNLAQAAYEAITLAECPDFFSRVRIIGQPNYNSWAAPNAWNYLFLNAKTGPSTPGIFIDMWMIGAYFMGHALNRNNGASDLTFWNTVVAGSALGAHLLATLTRPGGAFTDPYFRAGDAICWMWLYNAILLDDFDPTSVANPAGPYQTHIGVDPWPSQTFGYDEGTGSPNPEGVTYSPTIWGPALACNSAVAAQGIVDLGTLGDGTDSWYGSVGRMMALFQSGYTIVPDNANKNEGATITYTIHSEYPGETITVVLSGTGVTAADFVENALSFPVIIDGAGAGSLQVTLVNDVATEGPETLVATIQDTPISCTVTVADTSAGSGVPDPIIEFRMEGDAGETVTDTSGNGHNGYRGISAANATNNPDWVATGLDFVGTGDIAMVDHFAAQDVENLVIAVACDLDNVTGVRTLMGDHDSVGTPPKWNFATNGTELRFIGRGAANTTVTTVGLGLTTGVSHLFVAVIDGLDVSLRVDGVERATGTLTNALPTSTTNRLSIGGRWNATTTEVLDGTVHHAAIYPATSAGAMPTLEAAIAAMVLADHGITITLP